MGNLTESNQTQVSCPSVVQHTNLSVAGFSSLMVMVSLDRILSHVGSTMPGNCKHATSALF